MDRKKHFEHYNSRFMWEAILKSLLVGLSVGFALNFIAALVTWFLPFNGFWIMIAALAAGVLISMPIFYFKAFRPTVQSNARRIDRYGLEERLITMVEYEKDESYLAQLQRQDAAEKLAAVDAHDIRIRVPKLIVIFATVAAVLGLAMSTVNILAEAGILPSGMDLVDEIVPEPEPVYVEVTYMVNEGGTIEGDEAQVVILGGETTPVIAVPDDGYMFDGWDDGKKRPTRSDSNVTESVVYTAIFLPLGNAGEGDQEGDGEPGDQPGDRPGDGEGEGEGGNNPNGPPSNGAGGQYLESNQVINGETYYGSVYEEFHEKATNDLTENVEMSNEVKDFVSSYFDIIQAANPEASSGEG